MRKTSKKKLSSNYDLIDKVIKVKRVTKVAKGGRRFSFSALAVVGDSKGTVGHGLGKANEVATAVSKAIDRAKKNLIKIPLYRNTISHEVIGKYCGSEVFMKPASPGTGLIAGGSMRAVLELVGIKDILAKSKRSSNHHNVIKATFDALLKIYDPITIASKREISLEKVFK